MKTINYNDYDTIKLYVKKSKQDSIIRHYQILGWQVYETQDNNKYDDIVDLTLIREHKIKNKDELQLLQVYMEENFNETAKLEKEKHSKTTILGLCFGVFSLSLIVLGVLTLLKVLTLDLFAGIALLVLGTLIAISQAVILPRLVKNENAKFRDKLKEKEVELHLISEKIISLTGEHYE
ncbi:MAG: hypothetical protein IJW32_06025 [Clostridia bacterium]|nr:hypothetical protein [Clostridia bacterium]MBQ9792358.1 hypothetical protein [Clostridia bacterium]MBQ9793272.1 hypothetical protein [Clostridia bacterium]